MSGKPNILLIVADQLRTDVLSCYGNTICKTPHLDKLAYGGARFDNAYTVAPVCSPARCSLLTGLYPHTHAIRLNTHIATRTSIGLDPATPTFSRVMQDSGGYDMHYLGKWHVNEELDPTHFGYDTWKNFRNSIPPEHLKDRTEIAFPNGAQLVNAVHVGEPEELWAYQMAREGERFLKERENAGRPFFLRLDFIQPHFANIVPKRFADMYADEQFEPWPNFEESFEGKPAGHLRKLREWNLEGKDWSWWRQVVRMYYADVSYLDACCGIVLDALDSLSLKEDTIVIFTADHADPTGMHRHFEKGGTMYDEVLRVPMIIRWPGVTKAGARHGQLVRNMDLCPTILSMAGQSPIPSIHARDMSGILTGRDPAWYDSVYSEYHGDVWGMYTQRMVRTKDWKYVYNPYDADELYDMVHDPYEMRNLAADPAYGQKLQEMKARFLGWVDETQDVFTYDFVRRMLPDPVAPAFR